MTPQEASHIYSDLLKYADGSTSDVRIFANCLSVFIKERLWEKGWTHAASGRTLTAPSLAAFLSSPAPDGIGQSVAIVYATLEGPAKFYDGAAKAIALLDAQLYAEGSDTGKWRAELSARECNVAKPLAPHGAHGRGRPIDRGDIVTSIEMERGNSAPYLTRRIKRDFPEIADKLVAGEFKSVRAAAKAAGIVRDPTPFELLHRAWEKASEDERNRFLASIGYK